jgi:hypothetical protein
MRIARSAGEDAANRRMRKAGRRRWTKAGYNHAVDVMTRVLSQLGYWPPVVEMSSPPDDGRRRIDGAQRRVIRRSRHPAANNGGLRPAA